MNADIVNNLKVDDEVEVISRGKQFTTYPKWFENNAPDLLLEYLEYNNRKNVVIVTGIVVAMAPHENYEKYGTICAVKSGRYTMLIMQSGLKKVHTYDVELIWGVNYGYE